MATPLRSLTPSGVTQGLQSGGVVVRSSTEDFSVPNPMAGVPALAAARAASNAGNELFQAAQLDAQVQNSLAAREVTTKAQLEMQDLLYGDNGFLRLKGEAAKRELPGFLSRLDDIAKRAEEAGGNDWQKRRIRENVDAARVRYNDIFKLHNDRETREWEKGVVDGSIAANSRQATLAATSNDEQMVETSIKAARDQAKAKAVLTNADPEQAANEVESSIRASVTRLELNRDPRRGLAYYEKYKSRMDQQTLERMDTLITTARDQVQVNDVITKYGPTEGQALLYQSFRNANYSHAVTAGVLGALFGESNKFDPTSVNPNDNPNSKVHPDSIGMVQWNDTRATGLKNFAKQTTGSSENWRDPKVQVQYIQEELATSESAAAKKLRAATTTEEALDAMMDFLRPRGWKPGSPRTGAGYAERLAAANRIASQQDTELMPRARDISTIQAINEDPNIPDHIKNMATAKLQRQSAIDEMARNQNLKSAIDLVDETGILAMQGKLSAADVNSRYMRAVEYAVKAGDRSAVANYRYLAENSAMIADFARMPLDRQKEMLASMQSGVSAKMAHNIVAGDKANLTEAARIERERRTQALSDADVDMKTIKERISAQVSPLAPDALALVNKTVATYIENGATKKAEELINEWTGYTGAFKLAGQDRIAAQSAESNLRGMLNRGDINTSQVYLYNHLKDINRRNEENFNRDPAAATIEHLSTSGLGVIQPLNFKNPSSIGVQMAERVKMADAGRTWFKKDVPILTKPEIDALMTEFDNGAPGHREILVQSIAVPLSKVPGGKEHFRRIATEIAGKGTSGMGFTAAMFFYSKNNPEDNFTAARILKGTDILAKGGQGGKDAASVDSIWQIELGQRLGNVLVGQGGVQQNTMYTAIRALYAAGNGELGTTGAPTDVRLLRKSIEDVVGTITKVNGQDTVMPRKGMDSSDFVQMVRQIPRETIDRLRTSDGTQISPWVLQTQARYVTVGDGVYEVHIPDPRNGGRPRQVEDPDRPGYAWRLNLKSQPSRETDAVLDLDYSKFGFTQPDMQNVNPGDMVPDWLKFRSSPPPSKGSNQ